MKNILLVCSLLFLAHSAFAQFQPSSEGLIIKVSDGTDTGRDSKLTPKGQAPASNAKTGQKNATATGNSAFVDPIVPLGMTESIQAAAFLERPQHGLAGFFLIFCVNDSIGGKQGTHTIEGQTYPGVFRLIRQKTSMEEAIPSGMTPYRIQGTFYLLGVSY